MFSNGSGSSISLETVTPSLVTVGPPNDLLRITLRPVGPSVVPTAWARISTPSSIFRRAASEKSSCFATGQSLLNKWGRGWTCRGCGRDGRVLRPIRPAEPPDPHLTIFARMSDSRRILISSPSTLISVPEYLPKRTSSPSTTPIAARSPESSSLPGPTRGPCPAAASPWPCRAGRCRRPSSPRPRSAGSRRGLRAGESWPCVTFLCAVSRTAPRPSELLVRVRSRTPSLEQS